MAAIIGSELVYFVIIIAKQNSFQPTEAVVVFTGGAGRIQKGYDLLKQGVSDTLIVSAATKAQLNTFDELYQLPKGATLLVEDKARTTFENALFVGHVIKENDLTSVTLVTSWYHMPRSYLLLRMVLTDTGVEVHPHIADTRIGFTVDSIHYMIYEIADVWGNLVEFALYKLSSSTGYK